MSFASFASGSNELVARSIAASIAELIISAIRTNAIASRSATSSIRSTPIQSASDEHRGRGREVDPHVPVGAEDVDDPLDGEVEALDDRDPPAPLPVPGRSEPAPLVGRCGGGPEVTGGAHCASASSRASISGPWS